MVNVSGRNQTKWSLLVDFEFWLGHKTDSTIGASQRSSSAWCKLFEIFRTLTRPAEVHSAVSSYLAFLKLLTSPVSSAPYNNLNVAIAPPLLHNWTALQLSFKLREALKEKCWWTAIKNLRQKNCPTCKGREL